MSNLSKKELNHFEMPVLNLEILCSIILTRAFSTAVFEGLPVESVKHASNNSTREGDRPSSSF